MIKIHIFPKNICTKVNLTNTAVTRTCHPFSLSDTITVKLPAPVLLKVTLLAASKLLPLPTNAISVEVINEFQYLVECLLTDK